MPGSVNVLKSGRRGNIFFHVLSVWLLPMERASAVPGMPDTCLPVPDIVQS